MEQLSATAAVGPAVAARMREAHRQHCEMSEEISDMSQCLKHTSRPTDHDKWQCTLARAR